MPQRWASTETTRVFVIHHVECMRATCTKGVLESHHLTHSKDWRSDYEVRSTASTVMIL